MLTNYQLYYSIVIGKNSKLKKNGYNFLDKDDSKLVLNFVFLSLNQTLLQSPTIHKYNYCLSFLFNRADSGQKIK